MRTETDSYLSEECDGCITTKELGTVMREAYRRSSVAVKELKHSDPDPDLDRGGAGGGAQIQIQIQIQLKQRSGQAAHAMEWSRRRSSMVVWGGEVWWFGRERRRRQEREKNPISC
ncbi:hypothetical protein Droror1_Dr00023266 [Drosera rotundifolia]